MMKFERAPGAAHFGKLRGTFDGERASMGRIAAERPTDGYATLLHRMRVPGGYIYKDTTMYLRGFFGPKFTTSLVFVPDTAKPN